MNSPALLLALVMLVGAGLRPIETVNTHTAPRVALTGSVKVLGQLPRARHVNMAADPVCSKLHPNGANVNDVAADRKGDIAGVVVYISDGVKSGAGTPPGQEATLEQKGCMYRPAIVAVQASQKLRIVNEDQTLHNIHAMPRNNREWNKAQAPGSAPVEESFAREEVGIPVKCNVHPWMRGYIAVFKHPFFAVTAADGRFEIPNLPPGEYTVTAWHEALGTTSKKITVVSGQAPVLDFVFRSSEAQPGVGQ